MLEVSGGIGVLFGLVGLLFAVVGAAIVITLVVKTADRRRLLDSGLAAEARCLDTYTRSSSEGTGSRHAILSFVTADGREVRIQPVITGPVVPGDFVTVRYDPARPQRAVMVGNGSGAVANGCGAVVGLIVAVMFIGVGLFFAAAGFGLFDLASGGAPDPGSTPWAPSP
ncbi:DUF3592 domain-containing protein [Streptacidiphilus cavernicola]|uniref:DUF3592 domain-containing protein n=1 Tax=Streptacidiphilus cavernicola TaxID=3342716 RepID=A0ABV6VZ15_9ACTN